MEIIFLIGVPGCGKTTWRNSFCHDNPSYVVISTDDLLEQEMAVSGKSYSEVWSHSYPQIATQALEQLKEALAQGKNIIIDRTNLVSVDPNPDPNSPYAKQAKLERQSLLALVPKDYQRIALVFDASDAVIEERRIQRFELGKKIPREAIERMRRMYQPPTSKEFDAILTPAEFNTCHRPLTSRSNVTQHSRASQR